MSATNQLAYAAQSRRRIRRGPFVRGLLWFLAVVFWSGIGAITVAGATYAVAKGVGQMFSVYAAPGLLLLLVAGAILAAGVRRVKDLSVLHYLESAVRLNAPLDAMLAAAERAERKPVQVQMRRLRKHLTAGDAVSVALSAAAPALPRRVIGLITAGESTGSLPDSLRRVLNRRNNLNAEADTVDSIARRWYPMVSLVFALSVAQALLTYLGTFVFPRLQQVLRDFHVPIPASLKILHDYFPAEFAATLGILAGTLFAIACGRMLSLIFLSHGITLGPLRWWADRIVWYAPIAGSVRRNRAMADVCFTLANALDAGIPPSRAIVKAAAAAGNSVADRRMRNWAQKVLAGETIARAARSVGFPKLMGELLATTRSPGDLPETFRFLCRYYDGRFSRTASFLRAAVNPAIAICVGAIVLLIALGVFQPLADLMTKMSP